MRIILTIPFIIFFTTSLSAEIKKPNPTIQPEDVVKIQLNSLMQNNEPYLNAGIEQTWEFAHPSNRAFTGPIEKFTQMIYAPFYSVMINHKKHNILEVKVEEKAEDVLLSRSHLINFVNKSKVSFFMEELPLLQ